MVCTVRHTPCQALLQVLCCVSCSMCHGEHHALASWKVPVHMHYVCATSKGTKALPKQQCFLQSCKFELQVMQIQTLYALCVHRVKATRI